MAIPNTAEFLKFANLQMAAEAFLVTPIGVPLTGQDYINALKTGNDHASKFTESEATKFASEWQVVDQRPNTTTGFSGTLFKNNETGELVISFRSTEFVDDAIRDSAATNTLEVFNTGWAWGQIADMEAWYSELLDKRDNDGQLVLSGKTYSVTGYSLGGHLATAFNLLHPGAAAQVVTFNGAGVGKVKAGHTLQGVLGYFNDLRTNPTSIKAALGFSLAGLGDFYDALRLNLADKTWTAAQAKAALAGQRTMYNDADRLIFDGETRPLQKSLDAILSLQAEADRIKNFTSGGATDTAPKVVPATEILAQTLDYRLAVYLAGQRTESKLSVLSKTLGDPPLTNQWDLVGKETTTPPWSAVANSGFHHGTNVDLFIEDQPLTRGNFVGTFVRGLTGFEINLLQDKYDLNNFADNHSLVLIVDSLKVQDALLNLVAPAQRPTATGTLTTILKNASWRKVESNGGQGKAEGDVLENTVNALADLILGPQKKADRLNGNLNGNTWADTADTTVGGRNYAGRDGLHAKLRDIVGSEAYGWLAGRLTLDPATGDLAGIARTDYLAYAALVGLSPFVFGATPPLSEVDRDAAFGPQGAYADWKADLADLAAGKAREGLRISDEWLADRAEFLARKTGFNAENLNPYNPDAKEGSGDDAIVKLADVYYEDMASGYRIQQGRLEGSSVRKYIFGSDEAETLTGRDLADRLYGGAGNDTLSGHDGDDYLEGGAGDDLLRGGDGTDTYRAGRGTDTVHDSDGLGRLIFAGAELTGTLTRDGTQRGRYTSSARPELVIHFIGKPGEPGRLEITDPAGARVILQNWKSSELGLTLSDSTDTRTFTDLTGTPEGDNSQLSTPPHGASLVAGGPNQKVYGYGGSDLIELGFDGDIGYGGAGNDILRNGDGNQVLYGEEGDDILIASGGNDSLEGGLGDDALQGGAGDDLLDGGEGMDLVDGGQGADVIKGGAGDDFIFGGGNLIVRLDSSAGPLDYQHFADAQVKMLHRDNEGRLTLPVLIGVAPDDTRVQVAPTPHVVDDAADVIDAGEGDDWVFAGDGDDLVEGQGGKDILVGDAGNDWIEGGDGDDNLRGDGALGDLAAPEGGPGLVTWTLDQFHGADYIDGGDGNDFISGDGGADELFGGVGDDVLIGDSNGVAADYHGADYLDGEDGNDSLYGYGRDDILFGGAGDDSLEGDSSAVAYDKHGNDYLDGEDGNDLLKGDGGNDSLFGGAGNDQLFGDTDDTPAPNQGADYLDGEDGDDYLRGYGGNDTLIGGAGVDQLLGEAGADSLDGGKGDDLLDSGADNDTLIGGTGVEALTGGAGDDTYVFRAGDGGPAADGSIDAIFETPGGGRDTVKLDGISAGSLRVSAANGGAVLLINYGATDSLAIADGLAGAVERFEIGGETLTHHQFVGRHAAGVLRTTDSEGKPIVLGGSAPDTLATTGGNATLSGGLGNDSLSATGDNNRILYARGDGTDRVATGGVGNVLGLGPGIAATDLKLKLGSLALQVGADPNDIIHFDSFDANDALATRPVDSIEFEDGGTMSYAELLALGFDIDGAAGDDNLTGTSVDDRIAGGAGNDIIDKPWQLLETKESRHSRYGDIACANIEWRVAA
ncbi:hypothetical protein [Sulfuritalea sp.]|uniref:hypothetical protein n=1 Tax=Sulfuritalea sp. TaxID=2480090 RepID=UPI001AD1D2D9|nr:hypothetical protein [Sulfuritalea sp.]MBN8476933.1 hypothetical protein [Sulfuritalea sp.]